MNIINEFVCVCACTHTRANMCEDVTNMRGAQDCTIRREGAEKGVEMMYIQYLNIKFPNTKMKLIIRGRHTYYRYLHIKATRDFKIISHFVVKTINSLQK